MAAERYEVDEDRAVSDDRFLLQRLWIPVSGEIAMFDWAHVAKRFCDCRVSIGTWSSRTVARHVKCPRTRGAAESSHGCADGGTAGWGKRNKPSLRSIKLDTSDHITFQVFPSSRSINALRPSCKNLTFKTRPLGAPVVAAQRVDELPKIKSRE
ncbi:hypothetical protein BCR44DRAFT_65406 [Catenaria anguillulae PL171]|uniref:Uncharacterized protein n=1 Tax=Catenaria anguillulae PL171 TaxID=765915 RepID=A0A1Y2H433_9FUNG|nr:hypothetical protein BCR44DRAFT_65406 [Catenaria anguillulae PL171]